MAKNSPNQLFKLFGLFFCQLAPKWLYVLDISHNLIFKKKLDAGKSYAIFGYFGYFSHIRSYSLHQFLKLLQFFSVIVQKNRLIFSKCTYFGAKRQKKSPKSLNNWFWLFLAIIWQKVVFYGPKPNEIWSKYSKLLYFDIVEVVKPLS